MVRTRTSGVIGSFLLFCVWVAAVIAGLLALTGRLPGQQNLARYQAAKTTSLTSAAETVTVQQVASGKRTVLFEKAWVYCSVACSFTLLQNGTAASATTLGITSVGVQPTTTVTAWSTSNVGGPTQIGNAYQVPAGGTFTVDLTGLYLTKGGGTGQNLTVQTSSITGTAEITIQWTEQ